MTRPRLSLVLASVAILLTRCASVFALDPSLDITQYAHKGWKIRDGFPAGHVESIAQTPDGYLWLGTESGLVRFDGVRHVDWAPPTGTALPSSNIRAVLAGRDGTLWIGTHTGLVRWNGKELTRYGALDGFDVFALLEDREGTVWVGANSMPTGRICSIPNLAVRCVGQDGAVDTGPVSLREDSAGNLWVGNRVGLLRWRPGPVRFYPMPGPEPIVYAVLEGKPGELLLGTAHGVVQFADGVLRSQSEEERNVGNIRRMLRDTDGGVWVGTNHGLLHSHAGRTDTYNRSDGLSGDAVTSLFEDREGDVWVATLDGLDEFREVTIPTLSRAQGLIGAPTSVLATADDSIWVGTGSKGLYRWKDGEFTNYHVRGAPDESVTGRSVREIVADGLGDNGAGTLALDDRKRLWIASHYRLSYFEEGRFVPVTDVQGGYPYALAPDQDGSVWIGHTTALIHVFGQQTAERIPWNRFGPGGAASSLLADPRSGGLWIGFIQGGVGYFAHDQVLALYGPRDGLGAGKVSSLYRDNQGAVWAATLGGLSRLSNGKVRTLTTTEGLPCSAVQWAIQDDLQHFWLGTACGVVRIDQRVLDDWSSGRQSTIHATVFDSADGVRSSADLGGATPTVTRTSDGKIWFREVDGIGVIDPRHLKSNKIPPPVHIETVIADRKMYEPAAHLVLPAQQHDLAIDYTALSLVAPEKIHFRHILEGRDSDWQDSGNDRRAFYTDLPPGAYRFRVMASNNSGVWNTDGAVLDFSIAPAFWQTLGFRVACVLFVALLLWSLYRLRLRQIGREFELRLDERLAERNRIARDLHDTLLQSFQGLMLRFRTVHSLFSTRPEQARQVLESAIDEAREALTEGRRAVQGLRSAPPVDANEFGQAIKTLGEELARDPAYGASVELRLNIEGTPRALEPLVRDEIYRIASEGLRNAYRHAKASHIEVQLGYGARSFELRVRDDGKGIDPRFMSDEAQPGHYGLRGMRERAKVIGGRLTIWSAPNSGTELELRVPGETAYGTVQRTLRSWFADRLFSRRTEPKS